MKPQKLLLLSVVMILVLSIAACSDNPENEEAIGLPNPASVYCQEQGGTLEIREDENGQYGVCVFPDGSECEEWAFYRGECVPGNGGENPEDGSGVNSGPKGTLSMPVSAVYGAVISPATKGPSSSLLVLTPEGLGQMFVVGETEEIEAQIVSIRDKNEPANKASFWGQLVCGGEDDCLLTVSQIHLDGPGELPLVEQIEGWEGVIYSGPPGPRSGGDDYFALVGEMPFQYGIDSRDPDMLAQLEALRDTGQAIRIYGELYAGRMDWNAAQIIVTGFELIEAAPESVPPAPGW